MKIERISDDTTGPQSLRINKGRDQCKVHAVINIFNYIDKETNQYIFYCPSLEISAYGATTKDAETMLKFSLDDTFKYFASLSAKELEIELIKLGWKHDKLKNKEYSKSYVDVSGELQEFAVDNKVEHAVLTM